MVQAQILELLVRLTRDLGLSMILVTHDLPVVAQVCDRRPYVSARSSRWARCHDLPRARHPYTRMLFSATPDLFGDDEVCRSPARRPARPRVHRLPVRPPL